MNVLLWSCKTLSHTGGVGFVAFISSSALGCLSRLLHGRWWCVFLLICYSCMCHVFCVFLFGATFTPYLLLLLLWSLCLCLVEIFCHYSSVVVCQMLRCRWLALSCWTLSLCLSDWSDDSPDGVSAMSPTPIPKIAIQEEKDDNSQKEWGKSQAWVSVFTQLHIHIKPLHITFFTYYRFKKRAKTYRLNYLTGCQATIILADTFLLLFYSSPQWVKILVSHLWRLRHSTSAICY